MFLEVDFGVRIWGKLFIWEMVLGSREWGSKIGRAGVDKRRVYE